MPARCPSIAWLTAMQKYNEERDAAGVILAGEGFQASSEARACLQWEYAHCVDCGPSRKAGANRRASDLQRASEQEAIEWVRRFPNPTTVTSERDPSSLRGR